MIIPNFLNIGTLELGLGLAILLGLIWLALAIWAYRDIRRRSRSVGWAIATLLLVLLLPVVGLVIYLLLRPRETLIERYDRTLQQEVWLQQIEGATICPGCARPIEDHWLVCPECHTTVRRSCGHCGEPLALTWQICPACARMVAPPEPAPEPPVVAA
jgi:hypothetical protein